jgi:hypothetical protein
MNNICGIIKKEEEKYSRRQNKKEGNKRSRNGFMIVVNNVGLRVRGVGCGSRERMWSFGERRRKHKMQPHLVFY